MVSRWVSVGAGLLCAVGLTSVVARGAEREETPTYQHVANVIGL